MNAISPNGSKLTATDNAVLRYNITLAPDLRNKLTKYFRMFAKSDVFLSQINDEHEYKDFIYISGVPYEVAYRDCGRDQLESAPEPVDLFLSIRQAYDNNVRICLVTPMTPDLLAHTHNWQSIAWLQPATAEEVYWREAAAK